MDTHPEYRPRLGRGAFVKEGIRYSALEREASWFDDSQYASALSEANSAGITSEMLVDMLHLDQVADAVVEWVTGQRATIPAGMRVPKVEHFRLGDYGA